MKIGISLLILVFSSVMAFAQGPTLRIVTETPGLPSELFYGTVKVKPVRLRPGTNTPITIDDKDFFVQQQYIDFLQRMPDSNGFKDWFATLAGGLDSAGNNHPPCPDNGYGETNNPTCDRVHVSAGFYQSEEFLGRGYWVYRFYEVALDNRPTYVKFIPDLTAIGGSQSPAQGEASKNTYTANFVLRPEFQATFALGNQAYVDKLEQNAEVTLSNKTALVSALNGGTKTKADVLREIVEVQSVFDKFFVRGFVTMEYFGYLRRDPDPIGYQNWVDALNADPQNFRHMIFGFIYSTEYLQRF